MCKTKFYFKIWKLEFTFLLHITFNSSSKIISDFTNNKTELIEKISALEATGETNYYQALINVDTILKDYTKEENRECLVLFLSDGYPNIDTPNEVGEYSYLKSKYSFLSIDAVQYHMGAKIIKQIKNISDNQYIVDGNDTFEKVLNEIANSSSKYDNFIITYSIDSNYFSISDENEIEISQGNIKVDKKKQKIEWLIDNYRSGLKECLKAKLKLNDNLETNVYPVSKSLEIESKINNNSENVSSLSTPVISSEYKVRYDVNAPSGCRLTNIPEDKSYAVFDTIEVNKENPTCTGYQFKGWNIITKNVTVLNNDYFMMPESEVEIRGTWAKINVKKSIDGTIGQKHTLYRQIEQDASDSTKYARMYNGDTSTFTGDKNIYYYYGDAKNNNVIFASYCWKIVRTTDTGGVKLLYMVYLVVMGNVITLKMLHN